jgi:two-component system, NarL family, response regulator FusR
MIERLDAFDVDARYGMGRARTRVLIVDDHPIMRAGLKDLLSSQAGIEVCGSAHDASSALKLAREARPDVVVLDVSLGLDDGIELARMLLAQWPRLRIMALSMHEEPSFADRMLSIGAMAYVSKRGSRETFLAALRSTVRGEVYLTAEQSARMKGRTRGANIVNPEKLLSQRELGVLRLIARGLGASEIAAQLGMAPKTVYSHRRNISAKLGVRSGREMLLYAVHWTRGTH